MEIKIDNYYRLRDGRIIQIQWINNVISDDENIYYEGTYINNNPFKGSTYVYSNGFEGWKVFPGSGFDDGGDIVENLGPDYVR